MFPVPVPSMVAGDVEDVVGDREDAAVAVVAPTDVGEEEDDLEDGVDVPDAPDVQVQSLK